MKVLFAVNNEKISESIVKKYQKEYKEIISYKNVYYFNAILKELQKDKSYDRIVISEDLEQFTNTSYEQMDKFIFDRLDSISDEATNLKGMDIPIILICTERRNKAENILVKLFGIGIYNAIIGNDRSIDEVCRLIQRPRQKKDAKAYYRIDSDDVNYQAENENDVSEIEIQNILAHYKRLGKNEEKYVESFDNIAAQYNDIQLRIISKFLPLNVRAVLEMNSSKYQKIMSFNNTVSNDLRNIKRDVKNMDVTGPSEKLLKTSRNKSTISKPIVVPSSMNINQVKKISRNTEIEDEILVDDQILENDEEINQKIETIQEEPKRGRGRPKKVQEVQEKQLEEEPKRGRGRPKKIQEEIIEEDTILPGFDEIDIEDEKEDMVLPGFEETDINDDMNLSGFEDTVEEIKQENLSNYQYGIQNPNYKGLSGLDNVISNSIEKNNTENRVQDLTKQYNSEPTIDIQNLLTSDKKIMTFVGTTKNGTSFIVNNIAELLSSTMGLDTAILDTTKNKNAYYIYTQNEESLRKIAYSSISNLEQGIASGIKVNKNLTVYTSVPNENDEMQNVDVILETLLRNHSVVLIDADFETREEYFSNAQEIYLIQTMDVLTIQPLTAFLRELKAKNILDEKKIRVIINKYTKVRGISEKVIIGGMAFYNDPAMSFMTELFDRNSVKYLTIPFEQEVYAKYLEGLANCNISLNGYSKSFMQDLKMLGDMVYPLVSRKGPATTYRPPTAPNYNGFSNDMNTTLNQMKKRY